MSEQCDATLRNLEDSTTLYCQKVDGHVGEHCFYQTHEALREHVAVLERLLGECAWSWDLGYVCHFCGYRGDERKHAPDCELKAALELGQANGHDAAAGSCPPKREGA